MANMTVRHTTSLPIVGLLGVAFVVLKLTGYIDWSWWWVTLPFWGGAALALGLMFFVLVCVMIAAMFDRK